MESSNSTTNMPSALVRLMELARSDQSREEAITVAETLYAECEKLYARNQELQEESRQLREKAFAAINELGHQLNKSRGWPTNEENG